MKPLFLNNVQIQQIKIIFILKGIRQERPSHLHPDLMHPAMKEKGRNIPATQTVPIVQKAHSPSMPPRILDGRVSFSTDLFKETKQINK